MQWRLIKPSMHQSQMIDSFFPWSLKILLWKPGFFVNYHESGQYLFEFIDKESMISIQNYANYQYLHEYGIITYKVRNFWKF